VVIDNLEKACAEYCGSLDVFASSKNFAERASWSSDVAACGPVLLLLTSTKSSSCHVS
jgi:hypothetical protein